MKKRAILVKLKNGRHRVATASEINNMEQIFALETQVDILQALEARSKGKLRRAHAEMQDMRTSLKAKDLIAAAIAEKFQENAMPIVRQMLDSMRGMDGKVGSMTSYERADPIGKVVVHKGQLPPIWFEYAQRIENRP